jgi:GntR family transcriptional regulator
VILEIDPRSAMPPYEQLRRQVTALVLGGALATGDRLPAIRQLANDLGLAGGTVARAYRELEADGVIATHGRRGTFVSSAVLDEPTEQAPSLASTYARTARRRGLTLPEALALVERAWSR